jgi:transcriptional regulator with PAS, ATPase and Fis domain
VRELENALEFAANMTDNFVIDSKHLPRVIQAASGNKVSNIKPMKEITRENEIMEIKKALLRYGNTVEGKKKAAKALGISLATLYNKLKQAK